MRLFLETSASGKSQFHRLLPKHIIGLLYVSRHCKLLPRAETKYFSQCRFQLLYCEILAPKGLIYIFCQAFFLLIISSPSRRSPTCPVVSFPRESPGYHHPYQFLNTCFDHPVLSAFTFPGSLSINYLPSGFNLVFPLFDAL